MAPTKKTHRAQPTPAPNRFSVLARSRQTVLGYAAMQMEVGRWYFAVQCRSCRRLMPVAYAPPPEEVSETCVRPIEFRCTCGDRWTYPSNQITRLQFGA